MSPSQIAAARTAALLLALAGSLPAPAAGHLGDAASFDAVYIPALSLSHAAQQQAQAAPRAAAAMARLQTQWPTLRARLADDVPGARWARTLDAVARQVEQGAALAGRQDWAGAHEALEHVRLAMMAERVRAGIDYPLDRLTAYHEAMERITSAASAGPAAVGAKRAELAQAFAEARTLWRRVEQAPIDAAAFGLSPEREGQWRRALVDEAEALTRLSDALRGRDDAVLARAAAAIKPPFARAYTAFGLAEGEAR